jgi:hypothetical protein
LNGEASSSHYYGGTMRATCVAGLGLLIACAASEDPLSENPQPKLDVLERSATTLHLRWDAMGTTTTYTVDYLLNVPNCKDFPEHNDVLHVTGSEVVLTGLAPATRYHIHVHDLPGYTQSSEIAFVLTLPAGSANQAVTAADYEKC